MDEKLIQKQMELLNISREDAIQLIADDLAIDKGAKLFELDPELEKGAKKARQTARTSPTAPVKREKKAKPEKVEICTAMMDGLRDALGVAEFIISNAEREFLFDHNGTKYKVTLACPRS